MRTSIDYLRWQTKVDDTKDGDYPHVTFTADERLAFLRILIGSTTYDIIQRQRAVIAASNWQAATNYQRQAEDNRLNGGFPNDAYEVFERLTEREKVSVRQNLRRTLLVTTEKGHLGMYLPIQVLLQIVEDADTTELFPASITKGAARMVASYDQICGLLEWMLASDINNDTSTVYDVCAQIIAIIRSQDLLEIYQRLIKEEAKEFRCNWNDEQRLAIQKAKERAPLKWVN